jgi:hypothetical protein
MKERLVLFGAGKNGQEYNRVFHERNSEGYSSVAYCDNANILEAMDYPVIKIGEIKKQDDIIITSAKYKEIFRQLISANIQQQVIGIFFDDKYYDVECYEKFDVDDIDFNVRKQQFHYLDQNKIRYENDAYIRSMINQEKIVKEKINSFLDTKDLYHNLLSVSIELSNICNYSFIHKLCPANGELRKKIISSKIVYQILDELGSMNFDGVLQFTAYNEPLIDPRLFSFLAYSRANIPNCYIRIYSNGFYLNEVMLAELEDIGISELDVTAYGESEWNRLRKLEPKIPYTILMCKTAKDLDNRLNIYKKNNLNINYEQPCDSVMNLHIRANLKIARCCLDWKTGDLNYLGDVQNNSIFSITNNNQLINETIDLLDSKRNYNICNNCGWSIMDI